MVKVRSIKMKFDQYIEFEYLSIKERYGISLIALLAIILYTPLFPLEVQSISLSLFVLVSIFQLIAFIFRLMQKRRYNKMYNWYLFTVLLFIILFISTVLINIYFGNSNILLMLLAIASILLLSVLSFQSVKTVISYLFHWHLKKVFPDERIKQPITRASLKKLSKYIDIEKQRIYLIVQYGENLILYGFLTYFTLWVVKVYDFPDVPLLHQLQGYLRDWTAINFSILLSLFSILLALLTICLPVQTRIIEEAEKRLAEKYGEFR